LDEWHGIHDTDTILLILSGSDADTFGVSCPDVRRLRTRKMKLKSKQALSENLIVGFMISIFMHYNIKIKEILRK